MPITEKDIDRYYAAKLMESFRNVFGFKDELEQAWRQSQRALWMTRATALKRLDVDKYIRKHMNSIFWQNGFKTFNEACYSMQVILLVQIRKCHAKAEEYR